MVNSRMVKLVAGIMTKAEIRSLVALLLAPTVGLKVMCQYYKRLSEEV